MTQRKVTIQSLVRRAIDLGAPTVRFTVDVALPDGVVHTISSVAPEPARNGGEAIAEFIKQVSGSIRLGNSIASLGLRVGTLTALARGGVHTVADLVSKDEIELLRFRRFGARSLSDVKRALWARGLDLADVEEGGAA